MSLLSFLTTFILITLLGGPVIAGWYIITRGEWYVRPDGSFAKYGMIFKEWSLFWEQYRSEKRVYYQGKEINEKVDLLNKVRPDICAKIEKTGVPSLSEQDKKGIEDALACKLDRISETELRLYVGEPIYMFPSWIRRPISACIICMSSVYGSALYWFIVLQVKGLFSWSAKENLAKFGFWIIFCLILVCYNKFLQQKLRLDV